MASDTPPPPRRIIRGFKALEQFVGYRPTRIREKIAAGTFPPPDVKGDRAVSWFEDTIAAYQEQQRNATNKKPKRGGRMTGHLWSSTNDMLVPPSKKGRRP
jgi:predicted DNA-binding transcriptional regulator AlpA